MSVQSKHMIQVHEKATPLLPLRVVATGFLSLGCAGMKVHDLPRPAKPRSFVVCVISLGVHFFCFVLCLRQRLSM